MKVVRVTVGASHKLSVPGQYETVNPSVSITAEVGEGEDLTAAVDALKVQVDEQFWRLAYSDYATALERSAAGTQNWLVAKFPK